MGEMVLSDGRKRRPLPLVAWGTTGVLSIGILVNAFFGQPTTNRQLAEASDAAAGTARLKVEAPETTGQTIQLKYDPMVESVQRELAAAGYYKGGIDGVSGRKTRAAIEQYQRTVGISVTGEPSPELAEHIRYTRQIAEVSLFTGTIEPDPDAESRARVRRVQIGLAELAYSPGEINGELTNQTRDAIKSFEHDRKMPETGEVTDALLAELAKMSGQSEMATQ